MYIVCNGGNMPLLQVRDFPSDIYEEIKLVAKEQRRTIAQQTIVLIKDSLKKVNFEKERRLQALEKSRNMYVSEEAKNIDPVKWIREDRDR